MRMRWQHQTEGVLWREANAAQAPGSTAEMLQDHTQEAVGLCGTLQH